MGTVSISTVGIIIALVLLAILATALVIWLYRTKKDSTTTTPKPSREEKAAQKKRKALKEQLAQQKTELEELDKQLASATDPDDKRIIIWNKVRLQISNNEIQKELGDTPTEHPEETIKELDLVAGIVSDLQGQLEAANGEKATLQGQLEAANGEKATLQGQLEAANGEKATLQGQLEAANGEKAALQRELDAAAEAKAKADAALAALNEAEAITLGTLNVKLARCQRNLTVAETELGTLKGTENQKAGAQAGAETAMLVANSKYHAQCELAGNLHQELEALNLDPNASEEAKREKEQAYQAAVEKRNELDAAWQAAIAANAAAVAATSEASADVKAKEREIEAIKAEIESTEAEIAELLKKEQ